MLGPPTVDFENLPFDNVICNKQWMFNNIPRNVRRYSPQCLRIFLGMFEDIPWNARRRSPECLNKNKFKIWVIGDIEV